MAAERSRPVRAEIIADTVGAVVAAAIGFGVGVVLTFTHRQYVPWGLIAGLLIVAALLVGFRLVFGGRLVVASAAVGLLIATAVLALPGAGGSVLVVDDPLGYIWAFGPTVVAVVVVAWPRLSARPDGAATRP